MSSEQEEGADHLDKPNANSDVNVDQFEDQKGNGLREHAKPRRRRRGKKRKHKKEDSAATCEAENHEECESELPLPAESDHGDGSSPEWGSDDSFGCNYDTYTGITVRPANVPMAPLNSTQFIMDDHDDCRFYMSFESPNPYGVSSESHLDRENGDIIESLVEDSAYIDIDYQYESPQDFDNSAYYDKEFELSYKNNRFEELMRLPRGDLLSRLQTLETRLKQLSDTLVKENPSPILENLQTELLDLQEKNSYLKECNSNLTSALLQNESSETLAENVTVSHEHDSEDSDKEMGGTIEQADEVINASNVNANSCSTSEVCDKVLDIKFVIRKTDHCDEMSDQLMINHSEDMNEVGKHIGDLNEAGEHSKDFNWAVKHEENTDQQMDQNALEDSKLMSKKLESEGTSSSTNSEDKKLQLICSNSRVMHCQPNTKNLVSDDMRTLNITSSDLFHIANQTKCSSSVPREGGMSPSETSVN